MKASLWMVVVLMGAMGMAGTSVALEIKSNPAPVTGEVAAAEDKLTLILLTRNLPPLYTPVLIAQATQAQQSGQSRAIGICRMAESVPRPAELGGGQNGLSPVAATRGYFKTFEHQLVSGVSKVTVLQNPAHGTLEDLGTLAYDQFGKVTRDTGERSYVYHAEAGYVGQDSATLLVEMGGYQVKVTYFFHVFAEVIYDDIPLMDQYCPNGYYWKISSVAISTIKEVRPES